VAISFASSLLTAASPSSLVTFQFSETVSDFTSGDVSLTNGTLSAINTVDGDTYTATFTATNFQSATGTVAVSTNYVDAVNNQGVANSANIAMTVGGGADPNDGPAGGGSVSGNTTSGADSITGTTGTDTLSGGNGNDTISGGNGNDVINGGNGGDLLYGGSGNDGSVSGDQNNDTIYGGSGNDTILGGGNDDLIIGGYGNDSLSGGNNNDTFQFLSIYDQQDVITDFNSNGTDTIVFDTTGTSAFTALGSVGNYSAAISAGYLTYNSGVLSYDADGSAGSTFSPLAIVTLTGTPTLSNTNVLFQAI
jgi:Ca2+-binding RTX toxin-like protein